MASVAVAVGACGGAPARGAPVVLDGVAVEVAAREGRCVLVAGEEELVTELEAPCRFVVDADGEPQRVELAGEGLFLVAGAPAGEEFYSLWEMSAEDECAERAQGVAVAGGRVRLSPRTVERMLICPEYPVDAKVIRGLFDE